MDDVPPKVKATLRSPFKESKYVIDHIKGGAYTSEMYRSVFFVGDGASEVRLAVFYATEDVWLAVTP